MRPDLPEIVALGRSKGFAFIQVNSNGLRLAESPELVRELVQAGLSSIFLQFDGVDDGPYLALRGRALAQVKRRAVANCLAAGLGVILVPVIVPGVNDGQLGDIVKFALEAGPGVRGVHFQPVSHFGRAHIPAQARITLPEIMRGLEAQTGGLVRVAHFRPPGCEHSLCSFNASYVRGPGQTLNLKGRDGRSGCAAH